MKVSARNHYFRLPDLVRPLLGPRLRGLFVHALLGLLLAVAACPARAQEQPDLWLTVFSSPDKPDQLAIAYARPPSDAEMKQDVQQLAGRLGTQAADVKIRRDKAITGEVIATVEANLPGLTNWATGTVNLDPLIQTFGRFGHFRVTCLFFNQFPLQAPTDVTRGPVRVETQVQGNTVEYRVWVDQARRGSGPLPSVAAAPRAGDAWKPLAGVLALTVVVALGVFLIVKVVLGQRRASQAREVNT